jgi:hypothetical protein
MNQPGQYRSIDLFRLPAERRERWRRRRPAANDSKLDEMVSTFWQSFLTLDPKVGGFFRQKLPAALESKSHYAN